MEYITTFISAFLGFLSALIVEWIKKGMESKDAAKTLRQNIINELNEVKKRIDKLVSDEDSIYTKPYDIAIWNGAIYSGSISELKNYKHFNEILRIYSLIESANDWENTRANMYFNSGLSDKFSKITSEISRQREHLSGELSRVINLLKETRC